MIITPPICSIARIAIDTACMCLQLICKSINKSIRTLKE